jgi:hypothetical protein
LEVEEVVDGRKFRVVAELLVLEEGVASVMEDWRLSCAWSRGRAIHELVVVIRWSERPEGILEVFDVLREGVCGLAAFGLHDLEGEGLGELESLRFQSGVRLDVGGSKSGRLNIGVGWEELFLGGARDEKRLRTGRDYTPGRNLRKEASRAVECWR